MMHFAGAGSDVANGKGKTSLAAKALLKPVSAITDQKPTSTTKKTNRRFEVKRNKYVSQMKTPKDDPLANKVISFDTYHSIKQSLHEQDDGQQADPIENKTKEAANVETAPDQAEEPATI